MKNYFKISLYFLFLVIAIGTQLQSCTQDVDPIENPKLNRGKVFVLNEGPFGMPNASISAYDPLLKQVSQEVYKNQNGSVLGEILQSAYIVDDKLMAVLNVSGRLQVMDTATLMASYQIDGLTNARYMAIVDRHTGYISSIFGSAIYKVSLDNGGSILDTIVAPTWTEDIKFINGEIIVTDRSGSALIILDPVTDQFIDTIRIGRGPNSMMRDKNGSLWVYCSGDAFSTPAIPGSIYKVDLSTRSAEEIMVFDDISLNGTVDQLRMNGTRDTIYLTMADVVRFSINNPTDIEPFFSKPGGIIYGLGVDPVRNEVYIGDGVDFVQKGQVYRVDAQKNIIDSFRVGVLPNGFLFNR